MDILECAQKVSIKPKRGTERSYSLPKPVLTAPSSKERTVTVNKQVEVLNLGFIDPTLSTKFPSKTEYSDKELYLYLQKLLSCFVESDKVPHILNKNTMGIWKSCFTHVTYDPNDDNNYESLEAVGDKILSYTFKTFMYRKYPNISASQLNNLDQHYMSTHMQSIASERMGLTNWLRRKGELPLTSEKIREDLMEAFFGTIDTIFNRNPKFGFGFGARVCMKYIEKLFDFDLNLSIEPAKTFVNQVFERFGARDGLVGKAESVNDQWLTTVVINEIGLDALRRNGKDLGQRPKIWRATRMTKKPSEQAAYSEVMYYLLSQGINAEWIKEAKRETVIDQQIGRDNHTAILRKAQMLNKDIKDVEVQETYKSKPAKTVYQVIGILTNNRRVVLESISSHSDKMDGYQEVISEFLRK